MTIFVFMAGFVGVVYIVGVTFLICDKRSPFYEVANSYMWISIPLWIALTGGGIYILERACQAQAYY